MKPRDAIDVVVAGLPPPGKKKPAGGGASADDSGKPDDMPEDDEGESMAAGELWDALGIRPKDPAAASAALADFVRICGAKKYSDSGE
jgi:hypothetical protein